jgi:hypothetical protein
MSLRIPPFIYHMTGLQRSNSISRILAVLLISILQAVAARASSPDTNKVLISNVLRDAPCGIAWVVNDEAAFVMDTGGPYVAGTAAPDDSFHSYRFKHDGASIGFDWGRVGNNVVGRISTDRPATLHLKFSNGWPGWKTTFQEMGGGTASNAERIYSSRTMSKGEQVNWVLKASVLWKTLGTSELELPLSPDSPVRFAAGISALPDLSTVDSTLDQSRKKYSASRPQASGDWGDFVGAIADNMNNSRLYGNDNHLVAHSVSRTWGNDANNSPYFCWDSFFTANLAALDDRTTACDTVRAILSYQFPEGLVPNYGHWFYPPSQDRSQPPVGSLCVWKMHQRYPDDLEFLKEVYPKLVRWHDWWPKFRNAKGDGLLEWGSGTGGFQYAQFETGWDDNLHYQGATMDGATMNCYSIDLSSMWSMDAHYLALLADTLGRNDDAARFRKEETDMNKRINERLWNDRMKMYCSRFWNDEKGFLTRVTLMNFYPLSAGAPDSERAKTVLGVLTDPKKFWGEYLLPTMAYDDPSWHEQEYWRGDVWAPTNYITWVGIKKYASSKQITEFGERNVRLFMHDWLSDGICSENYLSTTGAHHHDPHYTWGALLNLIGLESIVDIDDSGRIVLNGTINATINLNRIPLLGKSYDVKVTPGCTTLILEGEPILVAKGDIVRQRITH